MLSSGSPDAERLQCPKRTFPNQGTKCGRREREAGAESRQERSCRPLRGRGGGRHPDRRDAVALRGAAVERRSRPVRLRSNGSLPFRASAPATAGVSWAPRRGTSSACASQEPRARSSGRYMHALLGDTSFARSRNPCSSIVTHSAGESRSRWRGGRDIAVGQTRETGRNRHRGLVRRTKRGSPRITAPEREHAWCVRKGRRSRPSSLRGIESSGPVPARRKAVAEVVQVTSGLE
jgi:hypothetical protein